MDSQKVLEEAAEVYYKRGPAKPITRLQQPRRTVKGKTRETCVAGFQAGPHAYRLLYTPENVPSKYVFFYEQEPENLGDFWVAQNQYGYWKGVTTLKTDEQNAILRSALITGTPVLGTCTIVVKPGKLGHRLAYVLQRDPDALNVLIATAFETYDTSQVWFDGSRDWLLGIKDWVLSTLKGLSSDITEVRVETIYNPLFNIQASETIDTGRCVVWSLVIAAALKDMDLRTATKETFEGVYESLADELSEKEGYERLLSRFYGARRRKTQRSKFLRRGHNEQSLLVASSRSRRRRHRS